MAYPLVNGNRARHDAPVAHYEHSSGGNWAEPGENEDNEEDGTPEEEETEEEEDTELSEHAVSLATQWVWVGGQHEPQRQLARVALHNYGQDLLYDRYVRPPASVQVVDYRTQFSQLSHRELYGSHAYDLDTVQEDVWTRIQGKKLIGHKLWESLHLLNVQHPLMDTRDLALYLPFHPMLNANAPPLLNVDPPWIRPLNELTRRWLSPAHWLPAGIHPMDPPTYAEYQMVLYQRVVVDWENGILQGRPMSAPPPNWYRSGDHNYYL